jgi:iron complex outermembrane receptor protein
LVIDSLIATITVSYAKLFFEKCYFSAFYLLLQFPFTARTQTLDSLRLPAVIIQSTRVRPNNPTPHTNLHAADIRREYHAQDLPFLLSSVPSLVENSDAGAGIGYTGMRIRGSDPTRINVTINGIPLNDAESQGVFWVNLPDLAASASEIQVQRGVGASTNGAGAFGASVHIDIAKVETTPFVEMSATAGAFNTHKTTLKAGTGLLKNRLAISGRLSQIASDGYIDRATSRLSGSHLTAAYLGNRQTLQLHRLSGHEVTYQAWNGVPATYLDNPRLRTFNSAGTERPGSPYDNEIDDYRQTHYLAHYKLFPAGAPAIQLNGHYTRGYGFFEQYKASQQLAAYHPAPPVDPTQVTDLIRRRWLDNHFGGLTFALDQQTPVPTWLLGGGIHYYEGRHFGEVIWAAKGLLPKDFVYYDNRASKWDGNIFLKREWAVRPRWLLLADCQYRSVWYSFQGINNLLQPVQQRVRLGFFNPKAGFQWKATDEISLRGFAGIGHREPNRDDFTQAPPRQRPLPERLTDLETGLVYATGSLRAEVNGYYMHYRNQLALNGALNDVGAYTRTNLPRSARWGVELTVATSLSATWSCTANLALSRNRWYRDTIFFDDWDSGTQFPTFFDHAPLAFSPSVIGDATLLWDNKRFSASLSAKHVGRQYLDNTGNTPTSLPAYTYCTLRFGAAYQSFRLLVTVNNLLDARFSNNGWTYRYRSAGYDARPDNPYTQLEGDGMYNQTGLFPQAGRHFMATLIFTY